MAVFVQLKHCHNSCTKDANYFRTIEESAEFGHLQNLISKDNTFCKFYITLYYFILLYITEEIGVLVPVIVLPWFSIQSRAWKTGLFFLTFQFINNIQSYYNKIKIKIKILNVNVINLRYYETQTLFTPINSISSHHSIQLQK